MSIIDGRPLNKGSFDLTQSALLAEMNVYNHHFGVNFSAAESIPSNKTMEGQSYVPLRIID